MPRVYHRKSTNGCIRCKKRRVKCDEAKPECGACQKHQVSCQYRIQPLTQGSTALSTAASDSVQRGSSTREGEALSQPKIPDQDIVELALLHYFLTETISAFHDPIVIWKTRLPLVGLKYRYVLDALLSLAALDLYRHTYSDYETFGNAAPSIDADQSSNAHSLTIVNGRQHYLLNRTPREMQRISHVYFKSAIEGHRNALQHLDKEHFEPAFLTSLTIYMMSLYSLACPDEDDHAEANTVYDEKLWFSLGSGCQEIVRNWNRVIDGNALKIAGYFNMEPDFSNEEELFHEKHLDVFSALLQYGRDFELTTAAEDRTYEQAVSFLGLMYKCVRDKSQPVHVVGSYIAAFAAKVRSPFARLVMEARPRALAIVGHLFAIMRLVETQLPHYKGIATRQIPAVCEQLPPGWKKAMEWPFSIAARDLESLEPLPPPISIEDLKQA